ALLATLDAWLLPAFAGKTRLDALDEDAFAAALQGRLDWRARQALDALAPVRIQVPSGQQRRIDYALDADGAPRAPVLAVKLQELFGLAETPRIADGRVPLLLHLLSPAGRPLQVTADLRGFWERTWPEVRREMKGRYPKHPWPEDPWSATATHRAKPRGTGMERALECAPTRRVDAPMPTVRASRTARNAAMNQMLATLPDRAMRAAHHVGDGLKGAVPDRAIKWVETGAALAALKTGGRAAVGVV